MTIEDREGMFDHSAGAESTDFRAPLPYKPDQRRKYSAAVPARPEGGELLVGIPPAMSTRRL